MYNSGEEGDERVEEASEEAGENEIQEEAEQEGSGQNDGVPAEQRPRKKPKAQGKSKSPGKVPGRKPHVAVAKKAAAEKPAAPIEKNAKKELLKMQKDIEKAKLAELSNQFKELDSAFERNLARIYSRGGHKSGVEGCQKLIAEHCQSPEVVGVFLRALCNKNLLQVAKSASAGSFKFLEFHASLFGYMARMFKTNFKDTLRDIPPAVSKTVKKVIQAMKDMFF